MAQAAVQAAEAQAHPSMVIPVVAQTVAQAALHQATAVLTVVTLHTHTVQLPQSKKYTLTKS